MRNLRPNPAWPILFRDVQMAELEYEQVRQLAARARAIMLEAANDLHIPDAIWERSLDILAELERKKDYLRKVPRDLIRAAILEHYGMGSGGNPGDSGICSESTGNGDISRFPSISRYHSDES